MLDILSQIAPGKRLEDSRASACLSITDELHEILRPGVYEYQPGGSHIKNACSNLAVYIDKWSSFERVGLDLFLKERIPVHKTNLQNKSFNLSYRAEEFSSSSFQQVRFFEVVDDVEESKTLSLLEMTEQEDFIAGEISNTEMFIKEIAEKAGWKKTVCWLHKIALDHLDNSQVLVGILHSISHFDYSDMNPFGFYIALAVLRQVDDVYVKDHAIKAFENWNSKRAVPFLESLNCEAEWQRQYVNKVVATLKAEGVE